MLVVGAGMANIMANIKTGDLCCFATRPLALTMRYLCQRPLSHFAIVTAVLVAVGCSVTTQYGIKILIDALAASTGVWIAFVLLVSLIAADNLFWRLASWIANGVFVRVTGDLRSDLFR